jgi:energy-coupling factor transporter ATP-binding protein EcfA2
LEAALTVGADRLEPDAVSAAREVLARAGERLRLSGEHTVVAIAGATGSGKSSLFNALAGLDISPVGLRRPTTDAPMACVWGPEGAAPLLDWLGIPKRHQINRESVLDADRQSALRGLVLLDLPDHDSNELSHRLTVDRLVEMVDLVIWVVDPQKYADQLLHSRYLRRLAGHRDVTMVVLNQIDTLSPTAAMACLQDLQRLLDEDGLSGVRLLTTAAPTGDGVPALRVVVTSVVARREAMTARLSADLDTAVERLGAGVAGGEAKGVGRRERRELLSALAEAAGVPSIAHDDGVSPIAIAPWGEDCTTAALRLDFDPRRTVAVDLSHDTSKRITIMTAPGADPAAAEAVAAMLAACGRAVTRIKDSPGFIAQRITAMIANLGCEMAQVGLASPADIDTAMKLGLNYPAGPLELADRIGLATVYDILYRLQDVTGSDRYRPSLWLRRRALLGLPAATPS